MWFIFAIKVTEISSLSCKHNLYMTIYHCIWIFDFIIGQKLQKGFSQTSPACCHTPLSFGSRVWNASGQISSTSFQFCWIHPYDLFLRLKSEWLEPDTAAVVRICALCNAWTLNLHSSNHISQEGILGPWLIFRFMRAHNQFIFGW